MIKKGLSRLGIFFLYLVSLLPFWFLYLVSDILFVILYYIVGYRRKVVQENLRNSFPEKSEEERKHDRKKIFQIHGRPDGGDHKICQHVGKAGSTPDDMHQPRTDGALFQPGQKYHCRAGHYGNWEMACLSFGFLTDKRRMIVYKPQSNEVFTDFFNRTRSRFGATMISMKQTLRKMIEYKNELTFTVLAVRSNTDKRRSKIFYHIF